MGFDVIVVGATLAGHIVARRLAKQGLRVGLTKQYVVELALHEGLMGPLPQDKPLKEDGWAQSSGWSPPQPRVDHVIEPSLASQEQLVDKALQLLALPKEVVTPMGSTQIQGHQLRYWLDEMGKWRQAAGGWYLGDSLHLEQTIYVLSMSPTYWTGQQHFFQRLKGYGHRFSLPSKPKIECIQVPMPGDETLAIQTLKQMGYKSALRSLLRTQEQWQTWLKQIAPLVPKNGQVVLPAMLSTDPGEFVIQMNLIRDMLECSISLLVPCQQGWPGYTLQQQLEQETIRGQVTLLPPAVSAIWELNSQGYRCGALLDPHQHPYKVDVVVLAAHSLLSGSLQSTGEGALERCLGLDLKVPRTSPWYMGETERMPQFQSHFIVDGQGRPCKENIPTLNVVTLQGRGNPSHTTFWPTLDLTAMIGAMEASEWAERLLQEKRHVA